MMFAIIAPQAFVAPSGAMLTSSKVQSSITMQTSYAEYMTRRNDVYVASTTISLPEPAFTYADYLASRSPASDAAPAETPAPVAPASPYAEYLASRNAAAADPSPMAAVAPAVATEVNDREYDPWSDDAKTVVTFMVDGVPKKYRIMQ
jgi:hypothetical protein